MDQNQVGQLIGVVLSSVQAAAAPAAPGWKTSEFWLHIISQVPTVLALCLGASNPVTLGIGAAAMLGSSIYTACRSNVKATGLQVAVQAAQAAAQAITAATPSPAAK